MITCKCPAEASLTTIPAVTCAESFGQIQKVAFQRLTSNGTNAFHSGTDQRTGRGSHFRRWQRNTERRGGNHRPRAIDIYRRFAQNSAIGYQGDERIAV